MAKRAKVDVKDASSKNSIQITTFCKYCGRTYSIMSGEADLGYCGSEKCKALWEQDTHYSWDTVNGSISVLNTSKNADIPKVEETKKAKRGRPKKHK